MVFCRSWLMITTSSYWNKYVFERHQINIWAGGYSLRISLFTLFRLWSLIAPGRDFRFMQKMFDNVTSLPIWLIVRLWKVC